MSAGKVWAVVPVKPFHAAKGRLSPMLTCGERADLAGVMLRDVLAALRRVDGLLAGTLVVTADPAARAIGEQCGAQVIDEGAPRGLNAAVEHAARRLSPDPHAAMLVAPADLPQLSVETLSRVLVWLHRAPRVVIVPAHDGGTNLLGCSPAAVLTPQFGPRSFQRHREAAIRAGILPVVLNDASVSHDLDCPSDVERFLSLDATTGTRAWLERLDIGDRDALRS